MHSLSHRRLMGGSILAALVGLLIATDYVQGAAKKQDATKPTAASGLLPEGKKLTAEQVARHIDKLIEQKVKAEKVALSPRTDDGEFLRRVYLDIVGKTPSASKSVEFLDSKDSDKRAKLIDELLDSKDYGKHMADIWQALLLPSSSANRRLLQYYPNVVKWLDEQFNSNSGWDKIVTGVVTATGPVDKPGPAAYYLANSSADKMTDNVTRMFLGVQLQCAQCHNHPFTDWKQNEYWHMAAFFTKVGPDGNARRAVRDGKTITIGDKARFNRRSLPPSAKVLPPKFLGGEKPEVKGNGSIRPELAKWMTSPKNPFFARAMVNRTWGQLFGRGFINPVDDMHDGNANSHPELLTDLANQFAANGFDVKYLVRAICNSQAYQRSSRPAGKNADAAPELFAHMLVKPLTPGQLYDSLAQLMGSDTRDNARRGGNRRGGNSPRTTFINFFGIEDGADPTEYQAGIPQVLRLMNSPQLNRTTLLRSIRTESKTRAEIIEKLYLAVLSRRPTSEEKSLINRFVQKQDDERTAFADVLWALMNSSEFALNR